jgi:hypothetical protein
VDIYAVHATVILRVVCVMRYVMNYVLSQDNEYVKVDERGYEYTGLYVIPD